MRDEELKQLREVMGTEAEKTLDINTTFYEGVRGIKVRMIDFPKNPYRSIFDMVTATWGNEEYEEKWHITSDQGRKKVLEAVLTHQTLTNALEAPKFTFLVRGVSRSAFDQIARIRVGAAIASQGVRDNSRLDAGLRIPKDIWKNEELRDKVKRHFDLTKYLYREILLTGRSSWQSARSILPLGMTHNFYITINYLAFQTQCARRLMFCEQPDTVAAFWLMWNRLYLAFPVLGAYCRPACDIAKKCVYHHAYTLSEAFSCLFKSCGRWPVPDEEERIVNYFDFPSSTREEILEDLKDDVIPVHIPEGELDWEKLTEAAWNNDIFWRIRD